MRIPNRLIKLVNIILVVLPFIYVWFGYYESMTRTATSRQVSVLMLFVYIVALYWLIQSLDGFKWDINRIGELIFSQIISVGVTDVLATVLIWMLSIHFPNLVPGLMCFAVQCIAVVICAVVGHKVFFATHPPKKTVIIYDVRQGMDELICSYGLEKRFDIKASYPIEDIMCGNASQNLKEKLDGIENVFICGVHSHERNTILKYCILNNIRVFMTPRMGDIIVSSATRMHMFHLPFLGASRYNPPEYFRIIKRLFDILASAVALIITSPIMAVVAIMIKSDGGPVFYKQTRLTKDGKHFKIIKFRSMRVDAENYTGAILSAGENDPRITKVGRIIRACRLDELPQLWNILVGDMSVVGPRPERPEIAAEYEKDLPEFSLRLQCKAGLTGYAQVYGKYNTTPYDKTMMDLAYIAHPSLLEDITIMLATIKILFSKESTEGVGEAEKELKYSERQ